MGKSNGLPHGLVCAVFEPAILHCHQYLTLLTHTLVDAPSKINGDLLEEKRSLKALDSWGKQNTSSKQSVGSRVGTVSTPQSVAKNAHDRSLAHSLGL